MIFIFFLSRNSYLIAFALCSLLIASAFILGFSSIFALFPAAKCACRLSPANAASFSCVIVNAEISDGFKLCEACERPEVIELKFVNCSMEKIPKNLAKKFPELTKLSILNSKLKNIENLEQFEKLEIFASVDNPIEILTREAFASPSIREILITSSTLAYIEPGTLKNSLKVAIKGNCGNENSVDKKCESAKSLANYVENLWLDIEGLKTQIRLMYILTAAVAVLILLKALETFGDVPIVREENEMNLKNRDEN